MKIVITFLLLSQLSALVYEGYKLEPEPTLESLRSIMEKAGEDKCASAAILTLSHACLSSDPQSIGRIALELTNCLLLQLHRPIFPCPESSTLAQCLSPVQGPNWQLFIEFEAHLEKICNYPKMMALKQRNDILLNRVFETGSKYSQMLKKAQTQLEEMDTLDDEILLAVTKKVAEMKTIASKMDLTTSSYHEIKEDMERFGEEVLAALEHKRGQSNLSFSNILTKYAQNVPFQFGFFSFSGLLFHGLILVISYLITSSHIVYDPAWFPISRAIFVSYVGQRLILEVLFYYQKFTLAFYIEIIQDFVLAISIGGFLFYLPLKRKLPQRDEEFMLDVGRLHDKAKQVGIHTPQFKQLVRISFERAAQVVPPVVEGAGRQRIVGEDNQNNNPLQPIREQQHEEDDQNDNVFAQEVRSPVLLQSPPRNIRQRNVGEVGQVNPENLGVPGMREGVEERETGMIRNPGEQLPEAE